MNIIEEYVKFLRKNYLYIYNFLLGKKYNRKLVDMYLDIYFKERYYNYNNLSKTAILKKIFNRFKREIDVNSEISEIYDTIFKFILYLEDFNGYNLSETIDILNNYYQNDNLVNKQELDVNIKKFLQKKEEYLKLDQSNEFNLSFKKIEKNNYFVKLNHNVRISKLYSDYAINKVFNEGIINEDKLFVEYVMISYKILKDILCYQKVKHYILETSDLFDKKNKLNWLLEIINNEIVKQYVSLKFTYGDFLKHNEAILKMINNGYQITIILDDTFLCDEIHLKQLIIFSRIIIDSKYKNYDYIVENEKIIAIPILKL